MVKIKITNLLNSIVLVFFLSGCGVPYNGEKKIYREDGSIEKIGSYVDGDVTRIEFYREDETLEVVKIFKEGVLSKIDIYREDETLEEELELIYGFQLIHRETWLIPLEKSWKDKWIDRVGKYLERMSKEERKKEEYLYKKPIIHNLHFHHPTPASSPILIYSSYYDESGQLRRSGSYSYYKKSGRWCYYDENGQLDYEEVYQDGELID